MNPEPKIPADLRKVLTGDSLVKWKSLTPLARRDFITWIEQAKQAETRKRRIESVPSRLASGKRRICCFAVVPMPFYKALGANPKAKAQWNTLTSDERRNLTDWIDAAQPPETKKSRIEKACLMLMKGKRNAS